TSCSSVLHADDDAPDPAQSFFAAASSAARAAWSLLTVARSAETDCLPDTAASDAACSSADSACSSAATACWAWAICDGLAPDGAVTVNDPPYPSEPPSCTVLTRSVRTTGAVATDPPPPADEPPTPPLPASATS